MVLINVSLFVVSFIRSGKNVYYKFINKFMNEKYNVYLVSDLTGETLDRIFLSLKSQFATSNIKKGICIC